jgi:putative copper resistance protein D
MIYARAVHFAAAIMAAGVVFFVILIVAPALRVAKESTELRAMLWPRLAFMAVFGLVLAVGSGAVWLFLAAASMSGEGPNEVISDGTVWTVLSQTHFGLAWIARFILACLLAGFLAPLLSARHGRSPWIAALGLLVAAALVGALAWSGHALGDQGAAGFVHPAADVAHLIAAAAWLGMLIPLALLLGAADQDTASLAIARAAIMRFSAFGVLAVGTLLLSGIINTWYLAGSIAALTGTYYGHLLLAKIALFFAMLAIAAVNRLYLTPRAVQTGNLGLAQRALHQLRRNALIEALAGVTIICLVAMLGTLPPAVHAHHAPSSAAVPADASFVHIHTEAAMADVAIEPGRVGQVHATIHLSNVEEEPLAARGVTFSMAPPGAGAPIMRAAEQDSDGSWQVSDLGLWEPGNWIVTIDAVLDASNHVVLSAPIVIDPAP